MDVERKSIGFQLRGPGSAASASHVYVATGLNQVQLDAVVDTSSPYSTGGGDTIFTAPAQTVVVTTTGVTATPLNITATSATDLFTVSSNLSGGTIITKNGTTIDTAATDSILSLSITGSPELVSVDFTDGDPIPVGGFFSNAAEIELDGPHGSDPVVTTGTAAITGSDQISFSSSTSLIVNLNGSGGVIAVAGTTIGAFPFAGGTPQPITVLPGATIIANGGVTASSLTVDDGGTFRMAESGTSLLTVGSVDLAAPETAGDNGGVLDLSDNDMIARNTSASTIETLLAVGYDAGLWDGGVEATGPQPAAMLSSAAAADENGVYAIGYKQVGSDVGDWSASGMFDGVTVNAGDTVLRYTVEGDANLDGVINSADFSAYNTGCASSLTGWGNGDFAYHGFIDDDSGYLLDNGASFQGGPFLSVTSVEKKSEVKIVLGGDGTTMSNVLNIKLQPTDATPASGKITSITKVDWHYVGEDTFTPVDVGKGYFALTSGSFGGNTAYNLDVASNTPAGDYDVSILVLDAQGNSIGGFTVRITVIDPD